MFLLHLYDLLSVCVLGLVYIGFIVLINVMLFLVPHTRAIVNNSPKSVPVFICSIHNAVISVFQRKDLGENELYTLNEGVRLAVCVFILSSCFLVFVFFSHLLICFVFFTFC